MHMLFACACMCLCVHVCGVHFGMPCAWHLWHVAFLCLLPICLIPHHLWTFTCVCGSRLNLIVTIPGFSNQHFCFPMLLPIFVCSSAPCHLLPTYSSCVYHAHPHAMPLPLHMSLPACASTATVVLPPCNTLSSLPARCTASS